MEFKETTLTLPLKQTTIEWILCSPNFNDIVLIAPEGLKDTSIDQNYQEIPSKQFKKEYFNLPNYHCMTCSHGRKDNISPS